MRRIKQKLMIGTMIISMFAFTGCVNQQGESENTDSEHRIAVTSVATAELLDALEVEGVVGIPSSESSSVPERYQGATELGSPMAPDMEILSSLNPTIVLSPKSLQGELQSQYEAIGVSSAFVNLSSVEGMYKSIKDLGALFGKEDKAEALINEFTTFMEDYKERNKEKEKPTVLILMGLPGGAYVVATEHSYVGNLVELAGGINVYAGESEEEFINVNAEDMVQKEPDLILRTAHAMPESVMENFEREFRENDTWKHFQAVQEGNVVNLESSYFGMSATFAYKEALAKLEGVLYETK